MLSALITGCNRGIGLELAKQYLQDGWKVVGTCRNIDEPEVEKLQAEYPEYFLLYKLDLRKHDAIDDLAKELNGTSIDHLINNAGVYFGHSDTLQSISYDDWEETMKVNLFAPMKVASAFLPHLASGTKKILATISSQMGSIGDNQKGGSYLYRSSKTALNSAMKSLSLELIGNGVVTLMLHPGWVQTDMGGPNALIDTQESVRGMRKVILGASLKDNGSFMNYKGEILPW